MAVIGVNSLHIPHMPSLVHMPDLKRTGEVAGRSLCPCLPQVDADAMVWLRSLHGSLRDDLHVRPHSDAPGLRVGEHHQHSAC